MKVFLSRNASSEWNEDLIMLVMFLLCFTDEEGVFMLISFLENELMKKS